MEKQNHVMPSLQDRVATLISTIVKREFGGRALAFLAANARVENYGAYHIADLGRPAPTLSFWSGWISDCWFQRDADIILGTPAVQQRILAQIHDTPPRGVLIGRWHPKESDQRHAIYTRNRIIERVAVSSNDGRFGLCSFYLRSAVDGWFGDQEYEQLCDVLRIVHGRIGVQHQIVGTASHNVQSGATASRLRDCNVPAFVDLSPREADICDLPLEGKSVAATALDLSVAEATIRTLRAWAYRKLSVESATQLMALFVRSQSQL